MKYELTVVLPGEVSAAKKKSAKELVEKIVKVSKGTVGKVDEWGKRELAYKIGKETTGTFLLFNLELEPGAVSVLNEKLRLEEGVLRYLLIKS